MLACPKKGVGSHMCVRLFVMCASYWARRDRLVTFSTIPTVCSRWYSVCPPGWGSSTTPGFQTLGFQCFVWGYLRCLSGWGSRGWSDSWGMAAFWAEIARVLASEICHVATWSSSCVFAKYYHIDLSAKPFGAKVCGVVAGGWPSKSQWSTSVFFCLPLLSPVNFIPAVGSGVHIPSVNGTKGG